MTMRLIEQDYNEVSGMTTQYWLHPGGRKVTVRRYQDAEPIINSNVAQFNGKSSKGRLNEAEGLGTKVASIPMGLIEQLEKERNINILTCTEAELKRLLNDPEFRRLRTAPGRI